MIRVFKKLNYCLLFVILLFVFYSVLQPTIYALSPEQQKLYDSGIYYYDIEGSKCKLDNSVPNSATNNKVYIMGDSYSVGIDSTLTKDLKDAGYDVVGKNEDNAGTITANGGDGGTPAIDALDKDKAKIADAGSMVVLLGTNGGENDIPKFMDKLNSINPNIKVYWMTVGYSNASDADLEARNKVTKDFATKYNYTIADWYSAYSKDKSLSDGVHPTAKGYKVLSKLFTDAMGKFSGTGISSTSGAGAFMTTDSSQSNEKRVWTFLTSPDGLGLTPEQAAGVMGNLQQESGINPKLDDGTNFGIASWIAERVTNLKNFAKKNNKDPKDLDAQLNFLKKELLADKSTLQKLKKTNDVVEATVIFHDGFERSADTADFVRNTRGGYAKGFFKKFTGSDPVSLGSSSNSSDQCLCTTDPSNAPTIVLDPGHSGTDTDKIDPTTGLRDHDFPNIPEITDAWKVSEIAKKELETAGYKVILTKDSANETSGFRKKAAIADAANADLAISIHTDSGLPNTGQIFKQSVGLYRETPDGKKVEFKDAEVATKSEKYANIFKEARQKVEGKDIIVKDNSYDGREADGVMPGNIATIMLMSKTPWVYLEKKAGPKGLSGKQEKDYAKSVVDGVKAAIPIDKSSTSTQVENCPSTGGGSLMQVVQDYAWEDGREVGSGGGEAKPAYMDATIKAFKDGKYTGAYSGNGLKGFFTDCGGFVTRAVQDSIDPNYNNTKKFKGPTPDQEGYLKATSDLYTALGPQKSTTSLQPGDIAVVNSGDGLGGSGHTFIYTGKINDSWKGNAASASGFSLVPHASNAYFSDDRGQYLWFRHK